VAGRTCSTRLPRSHLPVLPPIQDTVAPMAILKELGAPESLQIIVEGESLLNDGSALVLFTLARGMVLSGEVPTALEGFVSLVRLSLGGPIVGLCVGALASYILGFILNDPLSEITTTVVVGYGSFILAESTGLHASGVLAMVVAGLYMSFYGAARGERNRRRGKGGEESEDGGGEGCGGGIDEAGLVPGSHGLPTPEQGGAVSRRVCARN